MGTGSLRGEGRVGGRGGQGGLAGDLRSRPGSRCRSGRSGTFLGVTVVANSGRRDRRPAGRVLTARFAPRAADSLAAAPAALLLLLGSLAPYVRQGWAQPFPPRERCVQVATGQGTGTGTVHTAECPLRARPGAQRLGAPGATLQDPTPTPGSWRPGRRCRREMAVAAGGLHAMRGPHARRGSAEEPTRQSGSHSGLGWGNRSHS